ncbi:MAG: hypothetical protein ACXVXJ_03270, partial [Mycobacteriaceae bacterium]
MQRLQFGHCRWNGSGGAHWVTGANQAETSRGRDGDGDGAGVGVGYGVLDCPHRLLGTLVMGSEDVGATAYQGAQLPAGDGVLRLGLIRGHARREFRARWLCPVHERTDR